MQSSMTITYICEFSICFKILLEFSQGSNIYKLSEFIHKFVILTIAFAIPDQFSYS